MAKLVWDQTGERLYETGIENCILFVMKNDGTYDNGVAWNGITGVDENPSGAEQTKLWADNINYLTLQSAEEFGATIKAYMYPDEFEVCDGSVSLADGVVMHQQARRTFALAYKTRVGNDVMGDAYGYKWHLLYGLRISPSARSYNTINDSPEAIEFSWEATSTPVTVTNYRATSNIEVSSQTASAKLKSIEDSLLGTENTESTLLLPDAIIALLA